MAGHRRRTPRIPAQPLRPRRASARAARWRARLDAAEFAEDQAGAAWDGFRLCARRLAVGDPNGAADLYARAAELLRDLAEEAEGVQSPAA